MLGGPFRIADTRRALAPTLRDGLDRLPRLFTDVADAQREAAIRQLGLWRVEIDRDQLLAPFRTVDSLCSHAGAGASLIAAGGTSNLSSISRATAIPSRVATTVIGVGLTCHGRVPRSGGPDPIRGARPAFDGVSALSDVSLIRSQATDRQCDTSDANPNIPANGAISSTPATARAIAYGGTGKAQSTDILQQSGCNSPARAPG